MFRKLKILFKNIGVQNSTVFGGQYNFTAIFLRVSSSWESVTVAIAIFTKEIALFSFLEGPYHCRILVSASSMGTLNSRCPLHVVDITLQVQHFSYILFFIFCLPPFVGL